MDFYESEVLKVLLREGLRDLWASTKANKNIFQGGGEGVENGEHFPIVVYGITRLICRFFIKLVQFECRALLSEAQQ